MKKLFAILMSVCLLVSVAAFAEEEEPAPFSVMDGINFGSTLEEVTAALGDAVYEVDTEHTHSEIVFTEVEVKNQTIFGYPAELHFLFGENVLVALHVDFDETAQPYDELKAMLTGLYGEAADPDADALGKAVFGVEDDGILDDDEESWTVGNVMILLEKDTDGDVDLHAVQVDAAVFAK